MEEAVNNNDVTFYFDEELDKHLRKHYSDLANKEKHGVFNFQINSEVLERIVKKVDGFERLVNDKKIVVPIKNVGYKRDENGNMIQCDYLVILIKKVFNNAAKIITAYPKDEWKKKKNYIEDFDISEEALPNHNEMCKYAFKLNDPFEQIVWFYRLGMLDEGQKHNIQQTANKLNLSEERVRYLLICGLNNMRKQENSNLKKLDYAEEKLIKR